MITTAPSYIPCCVVIPSLLVQWYTVPGSGVCWHVLYGVTSLPDVATFYCSLTAVLIISLCFPMINLVYSYVARWRVIWGHCRLALAVLYTSTIYSNISMFIWVSSTGNGRNKNEIALTLRNEVRWCMICTCMWHSDVRGVGLTYRKLK